MQNPFAVLGIQRGATVQEVRAAYRACVKRYHPDAFRDLSRQQAAKDKLVQVNIAYEEALRQASFRRENAVVIDDAAGLARRLLAQGRVDSALRMLHKTPERDAGWFDLHGQILLRKGEAEAAHASFRSAIRLEPNNAQFREHALAAAVAMRKKKTIRGRMSGWAKDVMHKMMW